MVEMILSELTGPSFDDNNFFLDMGYGIVFLLEEENYKCQQVVAAACGLV